ncbi:lysine transporter LysE [bacterium D16-51]|nr:lysine transporter LysE [bacterium D16-59]RKI59224.1 lysine transporter LysE [bacterium D16-51]
MAVFFLRGVLIGLLFGVPAGAVGAMTVQRTWNSGIKAGLLTGFGSSAADCIYACVGAFGLTVISEFLLKYQTVINLAGGGLVMYMGLHLLLSKKKPDEIPSVSGRIKTFLSSFLVGITNPAAVLTFLFAFSYFGISGDTNLIQGICLVIGVFLGTYLWWTALSVIVGILKGRQKKDHLQVMNRIFGVILCLFGMVVFIRIII